MTPLTRQIKQTTAVVCCALGLRHVPASISVEGVIAAEAAVAEQQTDEGAAAKLKARPVR